MHLGTELSSSVLRWSKKAWRRQRSIEQATQIYLKRAVLAKTWKPLLKVEWNRVRTCLESQDKGPPKRYIVFEREGGDARSRDRMPRLFLPSGPCLQRCSGSAQTRGKSAREGMDARTIVRAQKPRPHAKAVFALWPLLLTLIWDSRSRDFMPRLFLPSGRWCLRSSGGTVLNWPWVIWSPRPLDGTCPKPRPHAKAVLALWPLPSTLLGIGPNSNEHCLPSQNYTLLLRASKVWQTFRPIFSLEFRSKMLNKNEKVG